jgi:hypothetical protein
MLCHSKTTQSQSIIGQLHANLYPGTLTTCIVLIATAPLIPHHTSWAQDRRPIWTRSLDCSSRRTSSTKFAVVEISVRVPEASKSSAVVTGDACLTISAPFALDPASMTVATAWRLLFWAMRHVWEI